MAAWYEAGDSNEDQRSVMQVVLNRVALADAPSVRVYGPEPRAFLGSAHILAGELIADRLLSPAEVQAGLDEPFTPTSNVPPPAPLAHRQDA